MARRYSFIVIFFSLLASLAWLSSHVETAPGVATAPSEWGPTDFVASQTLRVELIEVLDRLVAYEHYYRSVYGHFTKLVNRLGYPLPDRITGAYDIRVAEASPGRLVITAFSEADGRTQDRVTIDQDFEVRATFALPAPRPDYIRGLALKHLRTLRDSAGGEIPEVNGVFRGFFKYEVRLDAQNRKVAIALGIRAPVVGLQLALRAGDPEALNIADELSEIESTHTGQKNAGNAMTTLEEAYLAQRIFRGEVGRYAKNWSELARIASFKFEDKAQLGQANAVPFGEADSIQDIDVGEGSRVPSSDIQPLEIEKISSDSNK